MFSTSDGLELGATTDLAWCGACLGAKVGLLGALASPLCGLAASRAHARNGGFRPRPDPHACHASGPRVCAEVLVLVVLLLLHF